MSARSAGRAMRRRAKLRCCQKRIAGARGALASGGSVLAAALLLQNEAVAPEHRARELLPLSMQELGDVIAPESTLDGDTLWVFTLTLTKDQSLPFILVT